MKAVKAIERVCSAEAALHSCAGVSTGCAACTVFVSPTCKNGDVSVSNRDDTASCCVVTSARGECPRVEEFTLCQWSVLVSQDSVATVTFGECTDVCNLCQRQNNAALGAGINGQLKSRTCTVSYEEL